MLQLFQLTPQHLDTAIQQQELKTLRLYQLLISDLDGREFADRNVLLAEVPTSIPRGVSASSPIRCYKPESIWTYNLVAYERMS